ncbi:sterile alpha motif domain-containing protein 9-like [Xiphophorus hellerii]|uniref:sterile alpha motif domain-containing protein 9-like n=1 Tax=Xiphophorus hellerii TaxID=8084 RepID=UPI0013B43301|nr:sterile alpha motif domain-containing protein 9-like [Xiphophorus hellerii]XP_032419222.1 sterile alpha motif domain-containing protein 9-like [Xiphophorus hellerii]
MDPERKQSSSPSLSMMTDQSKEDVVNFTVDERNSQSSVVDEMKMRPSNPSAPSLKSYRSRSPPPDFSNAIPSVSILSVGEMQSKPEENNFTLPPLIEDWTKDQVKDWLVNKLRVSKELSQKLYDQELSGACLASYEKEDLLELGVPPAPAIQILRQIKKFKKQSEAFAPATPAPERELNQRDNAEMSQELDESAENETVSSDSGIQSLSSSVWMLQMARDRIRAVINQNTAERQFVIHTPDNLEAPQRQRPVCQIRPFDKSNSSIFYKENDILPPMAGPSNLIEPVHEYHLLPNVNEASEREILYEFTREVFSFAASCMNSRTNGTIHFGVNVQQAQQHGQVVGQTITSLNKYNEAFESSLGDFFEEKYVNVARLCIRPPNFIQVLHENGTASDKWVIEVDVVPAISQTQDYLFYTELGITSAGEKHQCKTLCLFVREGPRSVNIFADTNPRVGQEKLKDLTEKVKNLVSVRKAAEENKERCFPQSYQGQRLKQLMTRGRHVLESSLQVIVVTDKCHPDQLEHMDFLKEISLFAVLEFDPESDLNGTCHFYRIDRIANLHFPHMYTAQDSLPTLIGKLNLFKQTSWIFCNGRLNEESEEDMPLTPSEWLKRRSGDISKMIGFLCSPDIISKDKLLVTFVLHSAVTDMSHPILETFCAIYRTLEGADNMVCICRDSGVFSDWKKLIESRCKEDISSKCIYELSLNEISSTVKQLKEPQTQSSQRYLPSTGSSSVLLTKKADELFTVLDILSENECENTEIEKSDSFDEFNKKVEENFYRGGQVRWWNFHLSEQRGSLPFIKRDKYNELYDLITPVEGYRSSCVMINLFHPPGCGGTTLAMHVLWNLRRKFRCAVVKNNRATNNEIAAQVINLLTYGKQDQPGYTPVLLLVDNWEDVEDLKQCIVHVSGERTQQNTFMVIILNCERTQFPDESSRSSYVPNIFITNKLSTKEQGLFSEKLQQLKTYHEKPETFYAFMIMTNNFSEAYITNIVSNSLKALDATSRQGRLLSFLALLNTFVNGSYMSLSLCEELLGIRNSLWKQETIDDSMTPYSTLLITFSVEEHGFYQAVRFLHPMIASNCLQILEQKHKLSLAEVTINILHCEKVYKSYMGKDFLVQNIQSMLISRHRKEQGDDKDTQFSPLIEKIHDKEGPEKVKELFEKAIGRFDRSATLPQALARYFCLREKDFQAALKWALDARSKNSNSYIADTVGQVYKSQLKKKIEDSEPLTAEALNECLILGSKAAKAFQESQELAKKDETIDPFDLHNRKRPKSYNTSGYVGETEVMMILLDLIKELPLSQSRDRYQTDILLQILKGHHTIRDFHFDHSNAATAQFVDVLAYHERFLISLKPRLKEIFSFFENYFTYLRPRSQERVTADDRNKKKLSEHFKQYLKIFSSSEQEKASEKARNPNLSLLQEIQDQRFYLETKRADSFAGLLQCLSDKSGAEMERIFKKWKFIFEKSPKRSVSDTVNFILINIVMHSIKPSSKELKKYEELVDLLNEELQKEGTHSNSTEMYYLSMLLMWPTKDRKLESLSTYKDIATYFRSAKKSFHRRFSHMFPVRTAVAHFFLGKSTRLNRIVSKVVLDQILRERSCSDQSGQSCTLNHLWQSGAAWNQPQVKKELLRVKGISESGEISVNYGGNLKIPVRPAYLGDIRSGCSREQISFYLGFTMEGPVAYNIKYLTAQ